MASGFTKDPDSVLPYYIDWTDWLEGDTITASAWSVPAGITSVNGGEQFSTTVTEILLSGGSVNKDYKLVNSITTAAGKQDDRTLTIRVRNR